MTLDWMTLWPRIYRAARFMARRLPASVDFRDLAQAGAERVLTSYPRYVAVPGATVETWVLAEARYGMLDYVRTEALRAVPNPIDAEGFDMASPYCLEDDVVERETSSRLRYAVEHLARPDDRKVAAAILYQGMGPAEAVAALRPGISTDRARVSRRMKRIKDGLRYAMEER